MSGQFLPMPEDPVVRRYFIGSLVLTSVLTLAAFPIGAVVREGRDPASVERTSFTDYGEERTQIGADR